MNLNFPVSLLALALLTPSCKQPSAVSTSASAPRSDSAAVLKSQISSLKETPTEPVVYIDSDSLLSKYAYYKGVKTQIETKAKKLQTEMERKGKSFQNEVQAYQKNAVNLTPDQKKTTEEGLAKKQQELQAYQQSLSQQLGKEEQEINQKLYDKVQKYLKQYCLDHQHKMVLTYSKGGNLLYGEKGLDVTSEVVKGLNEAFSKEK